MSPDPLEWRAIPGHPRYEASSDGQVRNAITGRVLRQATTDRGYRKVNLGRANQMYVHRVVCLAFWGAPKEITYHADHLDFNTQNNHKDNLRWLQSALNQGRHPIWGAGGKWLFAEQLADDADSPLTPAEAAECDAALTVNGW